MRAGLLSTPTMLTHRLRGVTVTKEIALDLLRVEGDCRELDHVWTNLIDHVADALGGARSLAVRARSIDGDAGGVVVEVEDDGPGMPPATATRVMRRAR